MITGVDIDEIIAGVSEQIGAIPFEDMFLLSIGMEIHVATVVLEFETKADLATFVIFAPTPDREAICKLQRELGNRKGIL
jgi:hypothetical protein